MVILPYYLYFIVVLPYRVCSLRVRTLSSLRVSCIVPEAVLISGRKVTLSRFLVSLAPTSLGRLNLTLTSLRDRILKTKEISSSSDRENDSSLTKDSTYIYSRRSITIRGWIWYIWDIIIFTSKTIRVTR